MLFLTVSLSGFIFLEVAGCSEFEGVVLKNLLSLLLKAFKEGAVTRLIDSFHIVSAHAQTVSFRVISARLHVKRQPYTTALHHTMEYGKRLKEK